MTLNILSPCIYKTMTYRKGSRKGSLFAEILEIVPDTDWCSTWDASRTIMLRGTSKKVRDIIDKIRPPTDVILNGNMDIKCHDIPRKIIRLATTCHISRLVLPCDMRDRMNLQLEGWKEVFEHCKNLPNLNLYNNTLDATDIGSLVGVLEGCVSLNLRFNNIGAEGTEQLVKVLTQCTYLNINNNYICRAGVESIENCKTLTTLTSLNLGYNQFGTINIDKILLQNTGLTHLDLSNNYINTLSYDRIRLQSRQYALTDFDISRNNIGVEGVSSLAGLLTQCPSLTDLNLAYNTLGEEGGLILAGVIGRCTALSALYLVGNMIGETGIESIAVALSSYSSLTKLPLYGNGIGEDSKKKITELLGDSVRIMF